MSLRFCNGVYNSGLLSKGRKNMKKPFSRREIIMCCFSIFCICILIYTVISTEDGSAFDVIYQNIFTIIISIICSICATALLPQVLQGNSVNDYISLLNQAKNVVPYVYEDTNDPNVDFNKRMNDSIAKTTKYYHFSDRALYLSKRLSKDIHETNERLEITVLLADINEDALFSSRKNVYKQRERAKNWNNRNHTSRNVSDIIREEKITVLRSLYALGQLKEKYNITIYIHKEIPFIRYEITDDLMAMSFLTQLASGKKYPSTLLYENSSIFRTNFLDYTNQIISRSTPMCEDDLTVDSLLKLAQNAGIQNCTADEITKYYDSIKG